jgi:hypothetical protein
MSRLTWEQFLMGVMTVGLATELDMSQTPAGIGFRLFTTLPHIVSLGFLFSMPQWNENGRLAMPAPAATVSARN